MNKETKIQRDIQTYLNKKRIFNFRVNADENTVGIPDTVACYCGHFIGIETKTPIGKLSPLQKSVGEAIKENNGIFVVPTSLNDIKKIIEKIGTGNL